MNNNNNITFLFEEKVCDNRLDSNDEIQQILNGFEDDFNEGSFNSVEYTVEYTVKDLLKICQFYGIDKDIKASKCKKQDIVSTIVFFESLPENEDIVKNRYKMWTYISELINDPKMKKYIIWT